MCTSKWYKKYRRTQSAFMRTSVEAQQALNIKRRKRCGQSSALKHTGDHERDTSSQTNHPNRRPAANIAGI